MMNRLNWATGLLVAYTNAVNIGSMVADEFEDAQTERSFGELQLDGHNDYRANHGVEPLVYDDDLAAAAQAWANILAINDNGLLPSGVSGVGENLAYYSHEVEETRLMTAQETTYATDTWYEEVNDPGYYFPTPGLEENPGTGHFTQVVWAGTEKLGCGVSGSYMVCRYEPAGNVLGEFFENVIPTEAWVE